jgi:hypothetical protein
LRVAIAARAAFSIRARGEKSYFDSVMNHPGFAEADCGDAPRPHAELAGARRTGRPDGAGASLAAILRQLIASWLRRS